MLMIQRTPRTPPRLTSLPLPSLPHLDFHTLSRALARIILLPPSVIPPRHRNTTLHALCAETQTAVVARHSAKPRLKHATAIIAATCAVPGLRTPHAQSMPVHGLAARPFEQYAQITEEVCVPGVDVAFYQTIRLFECEEVEH